MSQTHAIVKGISLSPSGQATVEPRLTNVLISLAIEIDDQSNHPVDVEHVLAAIIMAARSDELDTNCDIESEASSLVPILSKYVEIVFRQTGGKVGLDD